MRSNGKRLGLESLEDRLALACNVSVAAGHLMITGDAKPDTVRLADNGQGGVMGFATGHGAFSFVGITKITVNTEGGSDIVNYSLTGDLKFGQKQLLTVGLGSDFDPAPDVFNAYLNGRDIKGGGARLDILAGGGGGMDKLNVFALNTDVALGGALKTTIAGHSGNDVITQRYSGENDGAVAMRSLGGRHNDIVFQFMHAKPGSTGQLAGWVRGDEHNDNLTLLMFTPAAVPPVFAVLDGGTGFDLAAATPNVTKLNIP
jgi:hypothetical protein